MRLVVLFVAAGVLLSGQILSPLSLPLDVVATKTVAKDRVVLVRENGDLLLINAEGIEISKLNLSSSGAVGTTNWRYSGGTILQGTFNTAEIVMSSSGSIYFTTWCENQGVRTCSIYRWDQKSSTVERVVGIGDRILTNRGFVEMKNLERSFAIDGDDLLFITGSGLKLIRKKGQTFLVELDVTGPSLQSIGNYVTSLNRAVFLGAYNATGISNINSRLVKLESGVATEVLPTIVPAHWQPLVDFVRDEVYAVAANSVPVKFTESRAYTIPRSGAPIQILRTPNAGPMVSNGLRAYLSLDRPWDGRSFAPTFDSVNIYSDSLGIWRRVAAVGDVASDGKVITGFKGPISASEKSVSALTLQGWYKVDPSKAPSRPTFTGLSVSDGRITLTGAFQGINSQVLRLTATCAGDGQGVTIYPNFRDLFEVISDTRLVFKTPPLPCEWAEFRMSLILPTGMLESTNSSGFLKLPTTVLDFRVEAPKEANSGELFTILWTANPIGRVTGIECTPSLGGTFIFIPADSSAGEIPLRPTRSSKCRLDFRAIDGRRASAEVEIKINPPAIAHISSGVFDNSNQELPLSACGLATIRGINLGYEEQSSSEGSFPLGGIRRATFEWVHDGLMERVSPTEVVVRIPCQLGAGEVRVQIVREDGSESDPYFAQIIAKVEPEGQK